jgi:hypothetical protein
MVRFYALKIDEDDKTLSPELFYGKKRIVSEHFNSTLKANTN